MLKFAKSLVVVAICVISFSEPLRACGDDICNDSSCEQRRKFIEEKMTQFSADLAAAQARKDVSLVENLLHRLLLSPRNWVTEEFLPRLRVMAAMIRDEQGRTVLHWAVARGHLAAVRFLAIPSLLNQLDLYGEAPRDHVNELAHPEIHRLLNPGARERGLDLFETEEYVRELFPELQNNINKNRVISE